MNATTPHIVDEGGHFAVYVDRHDGRGWSLVGTTPTGIRAGYQEARDRIRADGTAKARQWAARYTDQPVAIEARPAT